MNSDTIVALSTARGRGAIAIVRISGNNALFIAKKLTKTKDLIPRQATLKFVYNLQDEVIDEAIVIYFKAPKSFTAEDIVEFQLHGGDSVALIVIDEVLKLGARIANPGEFSKRAFLNGKMDLTKAEAIAKLIDSKSKESAMLLSRILKGELKLFVENVREELIEILAHSEVMIDYADEDIPTDIITNLTQKLQKLKKTLQDIYEKSQNKEGFFNGYKVAIIGKPNVGKSSLLNKLLAFERAIVSEIEGTTRDWVEEHISIGSHTIKIIDTAGIRQSNDRIEKIGIEYSKKILKEADIVIVLFDLSNEFDNNDKEILNLIKTIQKPLIVALNKSDLEQKFDLSKIKEISNTIKISCKNDINILKEKLKNILDSFSNSNEQILISKRQIDIVKRTINAVKNSITPLKNEELEIFSFHINEAIKEISSITRAYEHSQMLDKMFGSFCLGK